MSLRPETGSRVVLATGSFEQECVVLPPERDRYRMVAVQTTRAYTTRDQFGWPVRHPKGEVLLYRPPGWPT